MLHSTRLVRGTLRRRIGRVGFSSCTLLHAGWDRECDYWMYWHCDTPNSYTCVWRALSKDVEAYDRDQVRPACCSHRKGPLNNEDTTVQVFQRIMASNRGQGGLLVCTCDAVESASDRLLA